MSYLGTNTTGFNIVFNNSALESSSCSNTKILTADGTISFVGPSAFSNSNITNFNVKIQGGVQSLGFGYAGYIKGANWYNSNITYISSQSFQYMGYYRLNYSTERDIWDFRNSSFPTIETSAFNHVRYVDIYMPSSVNRINNSAFAASNNFNVFFITNTPPTLAYTGSFSSASNYKIFVPYDYVRVYRTAQNWTAQANYIYGFALAGTWSDGDTLPEYNRYGYALT